MFKQYFIHRSLGIPLQTKCLVTIQKCLNKADDKVTCTRAMWCIGNQSLSDFIVKGEVRTIDIRENQRHKQKWTMPVLTMTTGPPAQN